MKQRMAAAFRLFDKFGFNEGVAGHLTGRDPEHPELFWVNPFGMSFGMIRARDLILVDHQGKVVEGDWPVNTAAFAIHSQVHAARPDVKAAAHTHSPYGRAFSTLGRTLAPITQDVCAFYGDHALFDDFTGVVLDVEEGKRIAHALGDNKAAILRNHGLLTVGGTVDEAAWWFITMERSCQVQLMADAAGDPMPIDDECATLTHSQVGSRPPDGSASSRSTTRSSPSSPTCSTDRSTPPGRHRGEPPVADVTPIASKQHDHRERLLRRLLERPERRRRRHGALACFAHPRYELIGNQRVYDGADEVRRYYEMIRRYFPDLRFEVIDVHHGDDAVVSEMWMSGTHLGLGPRLRGDRPAVPLPHRE